MEKDAKKIAELIVSGNAKDAKKLLDNYKNANPKQVEQFENLVRQYEYHLRYGSGVY